LPPFRRLTLSDDRAFRVLREKRVAIHARVHRVTGGVSFWAKAARADEARWRRQILIKALPPGTPRNTVEVWCEKLGGAPPWLDPDERKEWRAAWRKRNGVPERKPRLEYERQPPRVVSIGSIGKDIEDIPDDRDSYEDDEDFDDEGDDDCPKHHQDYDG
jgi:hypothetical protein